MIVLELWMSGVQPRKQGAALVAGGLGGGGLRSG